MAQNTLIGTAAQQQSRFIPKQGLVLAAVFYCVCVLLRGLQMVRGARVAVSRRFLDFTAHQDLQLSAGLDLDWPKPAKTAVGGSSSSSKLNAVSTSLCIAWLSLAGMFVEFKLFTGSVFVVQHGAALTTYCTC
jgi:hypothetical protein